MNDKKTLSDGKLIIANCSGFFGDRFSAAREMVQGGPIDFLTGDYLAELTMAILFRMKSKNPDLGYVSTFLKQMEQVMGECLDRNIRIVSNAGGLNPKALAEELEKLAKKLGVRPKIAYIEGDDLLPRLKELQEQGETFVHLDRGTNLADANAFTISANAYLGCRGIVAALDEGADIVIGGRIADASLVTGPAAWKFNWKADDWDRLAGAATAGHIVECGAQATGGNYSFFDEVPSFRNVGFPIAEVYADGSCVITKHPGTGGLVSIDTVKAQLLYEIRGPEYLTPDVTVRFDSIRLSQEGADRVRVSGVKGSPPPETTKVCINNFGGFKNSMTVVLTGLDIGKKARIVEEALFESLGGREQFAVVDVQLVRSDRENPSDNDSAFAFLRVSLMDGDQKKVGKLFSSKVVELALASIPGFTLTAPPSDATPAIVHWPALVSNRRIRQRVAIGEKELFVDQLAPGGPSGKIAIAGLPVPDAPEGPMVEAPLGRAFAARSGDKGGNANLGVWAKTPEAYAFLKKHLTVEKLRSLMKDVDGCEIERYELANLYAVNFYIKGILGDGVAASLRSDPQAKTLGEYFRAKKDMLPESILIENA